MSMRTKFVPFPWPSRLVLAAVLSTGSFVVSHAEPQHPYILFTADELPSIRTAVSRPGPRKNAFDKLSSSVSWNSAEAGKEGDEGWRYRMRFARALEESAVRYAITGNEQTGQSSKKALLDFLAAEDPSSSMYPWGFSVHSGQVASVLGIAFDCLYNAMSESERIAALGKLEKWYGKTPNTTIWRNYEVAGVAGGAVLGLAISYGPQRSGGLQSGLDSRFERIRTRGWNDLWNPGGSNDEGIGYSYYGYHVLFHAAAAFRNRGYPDDFKTSNAASAMHWYTRSWIHQIGKHDGYTDSHKLDGEMLWPDFLFGTRDLRDNLAAWGWTAIHGTTGIDNVTQTGPTSPYVGVALWFPDNVSLEPPDKQGVPSSGLTRCTLDESGKETMPGSGGIYWLKNAFGDRENLHVSFHVTDETPNHSHYDATHLSIAAHGVLWCMDTPYGANGFAQHNVMQINDKDKRKDGCINSGRMRGKLGHRVFGAFGDIAHGDFSEFFGIERADRQVMLVKSPLPYVLLYEEAANGTASIDLKAHFNSDKTWNGTGTTADPARLSSGGKSLEISVLSGGPVSCSIDPGLPYRLYTDADIRRNRMILRSTKPDTRRLTLICPRNNTPRPTVTETAVADGAAATLDWGELSDVVVCGSGADVTAGKVATDGRAALVRLEGAQPTAFLLGGGRRLQYDGLPLVDFGSPVSVSCSDSHLDLELSTGANGRIFGPGISVLRVNGTPQPVVRDGQYVIVGASTALSPVGLTLHRVGHGVPPAARWYDLRGRLVTQSRNASPAGSESITWAPELSGNGSHSVLLVRPKR